MALRDYQKKRVFDSQAEVGTRLTATRRLSLATRTINTRWWKENGIKAGGLVLNGTGCTALLAGTHPMATLPAILPNGDNTIVIPEMAVTDVEVFHALAHLVPPTVVYIPEPVHGPMFCRTLLTLISASGGAGYALMGSRLKAVMVRHKVNLDSIFAYEVPGVTTVANKAKQEAQREATIASLLEKLNRLQR